MAMPRPPGTPVPVAQPQRESGELQQNEYGFILDACLKPKHRRDEKVIAFIDSFIRCKSIAQASDEVGVKSSVGYAWRNSHDIANAIQKLIDRSTVKHGFDSSEVLQRAKEIVDFDPIDLQNADGTFKDNLHEIPPEARRNLKKLKCKNIWGEQEDMNGIKKNIIIGRVIEYEFYDKLKAVELVGKEKDMFKNTTKVEHTVSKDMASILLESAKRGSAASIEFKDKAVIDAHYTNVEESE